MPQAVKIKANYKNTKSQEIIRTAEEHRVTRGGSPRSTLVLTARLKHQGPLPGSRGRLGQDRPDCSLPRGPDSAGVFWPLCSSQTMLLHYADVTRWPPNTASSYRSARPKVVRPHHSWSGCDSLTSAALVISHHRSLAGTRLMGL